MARYNITFLAVLLLIMAFIQTGFVLDDINKGKVFAAIFDGGMAAVSYFVSVKVIVKLMRRRVR